MGRALLGELFVNSKVITREQLEEVLAAPRVPGKKIGQILIERGWVTEAQLTQTLSLQHGIPWVSLYHIDFSRQLLNRVPRDIAERYCLVPIFVRHVKGQGDTLYIATDDPKNETALAEVVRSSGLPTRPMIASPSDIRSAIRVYYGEGQVPEALPFNLKGISIYCLTAGEIGTEEYLLAGSEDGYVYRLDRGNSFDGVPFDYYLVTPFNHFGDATREDRFHKIVLEMIAPNYTEIGITAMFDYGDGEKPTASGEFFVVYGNGGIFNAVTWNNFVWSSSAEGRAEAAIDGIGRNAAFVIAGTTEIEQDSHVLQAYIVYRSPRKFKR